MCAVISVITSFLADVAHGPYHVQNVPRATVTTWMCPILPLVQREE
jgi:hypothetical protein